ncbi:ribokinase [Streptomyces sp. NBC_00887]|uniref:ribokinase n=1 Tax=Streptomyces sp. NBC_00887 TaxID=2975859 RepID=UPI00387082C6|nr:ribokinase [Streptomyces sp. NBC_00887]WSY36216.1 ribokinase [Streptomyces sp. NBC_00887]
MYRYDVLVIGSANADLMISVDRRPAAGETVLGSDLVTLPGGKGANQAVAAARLGARTALLARVGNDAHGRLLIDSLATAGVVTPAIRTDSAPTGVALITTDPTGDNSIVVSPGANGRFGPADATRILALSGRARVVSLQLEIPVETVIATAAAASASGARIVMNPSPPQPLPPSTLALCDPLVVNEHEAVHLLGDIGRGDSGPEQWAAQLLAMGPRSVVITLGSAGALVADAKGTVRVPGLPVQAVDTTGAGDAFTGALSWRLAQNDSLATAARFAVRVAAYAVTRRGTQLSYPTLEQLRDL